MNYNFILEGGSILIDIHTHIFPDALAPRAIKALKNGVYEKNHFDAINYTDGTYNGLLKSMNDCKVDISIALPVATTVMQSESINKFAYTIRDDSVISFAGIHPMQDNMEKTLENIKNMRFLGFKLHPQFQDCDIDGKESIKLLQKAEQLGLYAVIHAGEDLSVMGGVHASPQKIRNAMEYVSGKYLIAAHLGGWNMWDDVEKYLVGTPVYLDTAMLSKFIDKNQYKRIINSHGSEKILFGSDSPWEKPSDTLNCLEELGLPQNDLENITFLNAKRLFNL